LISRLGRVAIAFLALGGGLAGQQAAAPIRVLKISAGPAGHEANGTFVLTDERSIFNRADDKEVLVLFEWDGTTGAHKLVAQWRSPNGGTTSMSTIDYMARAPRFGAYWSLTLSPGMTLGTWSIEATVDGLPGGRFTFEITDNKAPSAVTKRVLASSELFDRLARASVVLRRADAAGRDLAAAAGYSAGGGMIYTAMAALDDVEGLRVMTPEGTAKPLTSVTAWNRRQDWAVLVGGAAVEPLPVADASAAKIGDRCFSIERSAAGNSVIAECTISGREAQGGSSLLATFSADGGTMGAPILNEFGEIIGLAGGPGMPGATRLMDQLIIRAETKGTRVVPIGLVRAATDAAAVTLVDLRSRGETVAGLSGEDHAMSGGFARAFAKNAPGPADQRTEFSSQEKAFTVFVSWNPKARLRGQMKLQVFDADNRVVAESKPVKADLRKDEVSRSSWDLPMLKAPGMYRADVMLDATPIWRGFVRITP
jgi:hypothetical protein